MSSTKPKPKPSPQELEDMAGEHLPYEIEMLRRCAKILSKVAAPDETDDEKAVRNMTIESFCLHARNLIDFFDNKAIRSDNATARDFVDGWEAEIPQSLDAARIASHKLVAHLSYERSQRKIDGTPWVAITQETERLVNRFYSSLGIPIPPARHLLPENMAPLSESAQSVTTCSTTGPFEHFFIPG